MPSNNGEHMSRDAGGRFTSAADSMMSVGAGHGSDGLSIDGLDAQLEALRKSVTELSSTLDSVRRRGADRIGRAATVARDRAEAIAATGDAKAREASRLARNAAHTVDDHAREHPARTAALALGAGLVVALCVRALRR